MLRGLPKICWWHTAFSVAMNLVAINKRIMPNHAERPAPTLAVSLVMGYLGSSRRRFESFRPHQIQFGCLCDRRARIQVSNLPDAKMILQAK